MSQTDVMEDIRSYVAARVAEGFESEDEIIEDTSEYFEDEYEINNLEVQVTRLTTELLAEHYLRQATWTEPTDCDKLDGAFAALERQSIVARQNFACCQSCGHAQIGDEVENLDDWEGYVFFHMQDTERVGETGDLYLAYGAFSGEDEDAIAVGHKIVTALKNAGLQTDWDGKLARRIHVPGLDWKRRR